MGCTARQVGCEQLQQGCHTVDVLESQQLATVPVPPEHAQAQFKLHTGAVPAACMAACSALLSVPPAGAKHELLLGPEREECITTIVSWIGGQVGKPKL